MKTKLIILLLMSVLCFGKTVLATTFLGDGSAVVIDGDQRSATKIATEAAIKKSISQAIESVINSGTKDEQNYFRQKGQLLKSPHPFVKSKAVISNKVNEGLLTVAIETDIEMNKLVEFLESHGLFTSRIEEKQKQQFPNVMVLVGEEINGAINYSPFSARKVKEYLIKNEFDVIDETLAKKSVKHDQAIQAILRGDQRGAKAVALQYKAGVLITGKAIVQPSSLKAGGMQSYAANITLEAIKADSGEILATAIGEGTYPHINAITGSRKAVEDASQQAVEGIIRQLEKRFEQRGDSLLVSISNINFNQLTVLKKLFKRDFKEIERIKDNNFIGRIAKLDLKLKTNTSNFAERIALKDFGTFRLNVLNFSPGKLDLQLKMKSKKQAR
jgi:hypothetical protein